MVSFAWSNPFLQLYTLSDESKSYCVFFSFLVPIMAKLDQKFFKQPTLCLAKNLLGCLLFHDLGTQLLCGTIVETEAYLPKDDMASHSARGQTARNRVMFEAPGQLYVYTIHTRFCANIVSEKQGIGAAVLVRAIEPLLGMDAMLSCRPVTNRHELTNGPGKLCQAFGLNLSHNGVSLITSPKLWLEPPPKQTDLDIRSSPRIGISRSVELPYRFFVNGNPFVSGRASDHTVKRNRYLADSAFKKEFAS